MMQESATARLTVPVSQRDHQQGPATAPVTLVEYGDYECPYCGEAYPIVKEIKLRLGDRLRFVFRNFPLTQSHPHAEHAAEAAEAAAAQGKFWEMTEHVYAPRVREDFLSGVRSGVNGTPTFFVNGVRHDASYALETLLAAIEGAMSR
jgi:protein-disulfide isomerase